MRAVKGYLPADSVYPFTGLDLLNPPSRISQGGAAVADNAMATKGVISKRRGYEPLGEAIQFVDLAPIGEPILGIEEYQTLAGLRTLVAITTKHQFKYSPSLDGTAKGEWVNITTRKGGETDGTPTSYDIESVNIGERKFVVEGNHLSIFVEGVFLNVQGNTLPEANGVYKVASSTYSYPNTTIVVSTVILPNTAADGTIETDVVWDGEVDDEIDFAMGVGTVPGGGTEKILFVTNGKDTPRFWYGTGEFLDFVPTDLTGFVTCRTMEVYFDHLVLGGITTSSKNLNQDVAWSDTGKLFDFDSSENDGAGYNTLTDSEGDIIRLESFADRLAVYTESDILMMSFIGGALVFAFERIAQSIRMTSTKSLVNIGPFHLFASRENFYLFDGTKLIRPIGNAVHKEYRKILSIESAGGASAHHDQPHQTVYWVVPTDSSSGRYSAKVFVLEYDIFNTSSLKWTVHTYYTRLGQSVFSRPTVFGCFTRDATLRWNSEELAGYKWTQRGETWDHGSMRKDYPVRVMGDTRGNVYLMDDLVLNDEGTPIDFVYETPDFSLPKEFQSQLSRWLEVEYEASGSSIDISYSTDGGREFTELETQTLSTNFEWYQAFFDVSSQLLRIRFRNVEPDGTFSLRWVRLWYRAQGVPT